VVVGGVVVVVGGGVVDMGDESEYEACSTEFIVSSSLFALMSGETEMTYTRGGATECCAASCR
jgi:hypothetical protein